VAPLARLALRLRRPPIAEDRGSAPGIRRRLLREALVHEARRRSTDERATPAPLDEDPVALFGSEKGNAAEIRLGVPHGRLERPDEVLEQAADRRLFEELGAELEEAG